MKSKLKYLILFVVMLTAFKSQSQQHLKPTFEGLSNRYVTAFNQDNNGLIWIGTTNGLNRFDGNSFKQFFANTPELNLVNSIITCFLNLDENVFLIGTKGGINKVHFFLNDKYKVEVISDKEITTLFRYNKNEFLAGTSNGELILFDSSFHSHTIYKDKQMASVKNICTDSKNNIWFGTNENKKIHKLNADYSEQIIDNLYGNFIIDGDLLFANFGSGFGLQSYNISNCKNVKNTFLDSVNLLIKSGYGIFKDSRNNFWVNYNLGKLFKINIVNKTIEDYSYLFSQNYFGSIFNSFFEDKEGVLWVGTDGGFVKIQTTQYPFKTYLGNGQKNESSFFSARGMLEDSLGNLYLGTYKGLFHLNRSNNILQPVLEKNNAVKKDIKPLVCQMIFDENDILMTTHEGEIVNYNLETKKYETLLRNVLSDFSSIYKDKEGLIWIGRGNGFGIQIFDKHKKQFFSHPSIASNKDMLNCKLVYSISQKSDGVFLIGSSNGLFLFDKNKGSIKQYNVKTIPALSDNEILDVLYDSDTAIWLGSKGGGLMKLNLIENKIINYKKDEGLSSNTVYCILKDKSRLWLSTENGLSTFDLKTNLFYCYYDKDGISNNEFNTGSKIKTINGEIFFGGINGVTSFVPSSIKLIPELSKIILTELVQNGQNDFSNLFRLDSTTEIVLPYNTNNLFLRFTISDYLRPELNSYQYKLEGIDSTWTNMGGQNFLRISNMPSGEYILRIKGKNMNGVDTENQIVLTVIIRQVFYKQWWFFISISILVLLLIYFIFYIRIKRLVEFQNLRIKIASDLHDEVGSLLTQISILTELLKYKNQNNKEIDQIASASREATRTMSDVLWTIDARNDKTGNLIDRMHDHADLLLLPLEININFNTKNIDNNIVINMQERQNLLLIFKEAINNIAKHSNATEVEVLIENSKDIFRMIIKDNGTENKKDSSGSGQGMKNIKMRAAAINAKIEIDKDNGYTIILTRKAFSGTHMFV
ncbi:MAG: two-component regulator propeller domain-containing protein [Bacteroidota bacterium]